MKFGYLALRTMQCRALGDAWEERVVSFLFHHPIPFRIEVEQLQHAVMSS